MYRRWDRVSSCLGYGLPYRIICEGPYNSQLNFAAVIFASDNRRDIEEASHPLGTYIDDKM